MNDDGIRGEIPEVYRILEHLVPLRIPGFSEDYARGALTLAPEALDCRDWYELFRKRLLAGIREKKHLPICRLSDGEYRILFGEQTPSARHRGLRNLKSWAHYLKVKYGWSKYGFRGLTPDGVIAGAYSKKELPEIRVKLMEGLRYILNNGIAAAHLTFAEHPFQEHFHPVLGEWLNENHLELTMDNYVPFYFVYALLSGPLGIDLIKGRPIGIIHSATGKKRDDIVNSLKKIGAAEVLWHEISPDRSAHEKLPVSLFSNGADLILLGAGVGKLAIFPQLRHCRCPVIDAGFMFEIWSGRMANRPFITSIEELPKS